MILPEILSVVLGSLYAIDKPSIAECSLVSKSWLQESHRHLFSNVIVRIGDRTLSDFIRLLESSPLIASAIRVLSIRGVDRGLRTDVTSFSLDDFALIISMLPALRDVRVLRAAWHRQPGSQIPDVHAPSVNALAITDIFPVEPDTLHDIFPWFPNLRSLNIFRSNMAQKGSKTN